MNSRRELMMSYIGQVISLLNLEVDERQVEQLILFDEFLLNYNEKMNLTRIVDPLEVAVKHFADSLTVLSYFQLGRNSKVIDIGAGAVQDRAQVFQNVDIGLVLASLASSPPDRCRRAPRARTPRG